MEIKKFHFNFLAALRVFCDTYAYHVVLSWEMYSRFSYNYLTRHPRSVLSQTLKKNHQVEMNVVCINIKQQQKKWITAFFLSRTLNILWWSLRFLAVKSPMPIFSRSKNPCLSIHGTFLSWKKSSTAEYVDHKMVIKLVNTEYFYTLVMVA